MPKHLACSESFYEKQVLDCLKGGQIDEEEKRAMLALIKTFYKEMEDGLDEEYVDLAERFESIDLESASAKDIWDRLTWKERQRFEHLVGLQAKDRRKQTGVISEAKELEEKVEVEEEGGIEGLIVLWKPWWESAAKVVEITEDPRQEKLGSQSDTTVAAATPEIVTNIKPLTKLVSKAPHPSVLNQLALSLLSYAYTMRHVNGDLHDDADASRDTVLAVADFLTSKAAPIYQSVEEALLVGFDHIGVIEERYLPLDSRIKLLSDLTELMDPNKALAGLSDLYRLFNQCTLPTRHGEGSPSRREDRAAAAAAQRASSRNLRGTRRLYFLLAVAHYFYPYRIPGDGEDSLRRECDPAFALAGYSDDLNKVIWKSLVAQVEALRGRWLTEARVQEKAAAMVQRVQDSDNGDYWLHRKPKKLERPMIERIDKNNG
ncbi:hypothetical protein EV182_000485 [Spiromyces aspiralis]|uniref:Uncharacterized protein n=1 Tax=Spiromyces aspiralis TaxID=68401 RepID=A0ACC1HGU6_9FUNG|nr:hypothetical protein EV182_000485 [Spiromyces aspiralis]